MLLALISHSVSLKTELALKRQGELMTLMQRDEAHFYTHSFKSQVPKCLKATEGFLHTSNALTSSSGEHTCPLGTWRKYQRDLKFRCFQLSLFYDHTTLHQILSLGLIKMKFVQGRANVTSVPARADHVPELPSQTLV